MKRIEIAFWHEDAEPVQGLDSDAIAEGIGCAFYDAGLNVMRNMEYGFVAIIAGKVVGATVWRTYRDVETRMGADCAALLNFPDPIIYDFDIAVMPEAQGGTVGWMLTDANMREARALECTAVALQVVNPAMEKLLVKLFGFHAERVEHTPRYLSHCRRWLESANDAQRESVLLSIPPQNFSIIDDLQRKINR